MTPKKLLVPVDDSDASLQAFDRAVAVAAHTGARVRVFHALVDEADVRDDPERRRGWLERARAVTSAAALDVEYVSHPGQSAFDGIMAACENLGADLVVMGTHGGGLLTGSIAERIVRRAPCHVMVCRKDARGAWPREPGTILVPVDLSDDARRAARYARALARDDDRIVVLHVVSTPDHPDVYLDEVPAPLSADPATEQRIRSHLRSWLDDPAAEIVAVEGEVVASILDQIHAHEAVLVVMGTRGLTGFTRFVIGSVAERITHLGEAPVVTVR